MAYTMPQLEVPAPVGEKEIILVASGDLRLSANQMCWPAQEDMERRVIAAFGREGYTVRRGHPYDPVEKHGFISSQRMGMDVFKNIHPDARLIVAESVWQYSHHVLAGLRSHRGPILTVANWSGQWSGLVGMLRVRYSTLWSERFQDDFFRAGFRQWLQTGVVTHDQSHVKDLRLLKLPAADERLGQEAARRFRQQKAILGVFDEGCMGMFNAIIPDELLHPTGVFKERLSQSTLYAAMQQVSEAEARAVLDWLLKQGMTFQWGREEETQLTEAQTLQQCRMYVAAVRLADEFGCDAVGIQYQQGLKDLVPASDLVEGLLNNVDRPPVTAAGSRRVLFAGEAVPHFNEVDECAGLDGLVTYRLWRELGFAPENTLHDVRWGEAFKGNGVNDFVWVFLISGAVPPAHLRGGYRGATSHRQPPMYFRLGGGSIQGVSKPGPIVWSRVFVMDGKLHCDLGVGKAVELPEKESRRRLQLTTPQWPIMHAVLDGITRDQFMARHKANHIQVVYAPSLKEAHRACRIKAAMLAELGLEAHLCGNVALK